VAFALFLVGALCAAAAQFWYAYILWEEYDQVTLNLWNGTLPTFETLLAIGILLMALGWLAGHLRALRAVERQPPRLVGPGPARPSPTPGVPPANPSGSVPDQNDW